MSSNSLHIDSPSYYHQTFLNEYSSASILYLVRLFTLPLLLYKIGDCSTMKCHLNGHAG